MAQRASDTQARPTPGPWHVYEAKHIDGEYWASICYDGGGPITDIVGAEGNHTKYFQPVAGMKYLVTPVAEQRANARLIASAPDTAAERDRLLAALEKVDTLAQAKTNSGTNARTIWAIKKIAHAAIAGAKQ